MRHYLLPKVGAISEYEIRVLRCDTRRAIAEIVFPSTSYEAPRYAPGCMEHRFHVQGSQKDTQLR